MGNFVQLLAVAIGGFMAIVIGAVTGAFIRSLRNDLEKQESWKDELALRKEALQLLRKPDINVVITDNRQRAEEAPPKQEVQVQQRYPAMGPLWQNSRVWEELYSRLLDRQPDIQRRADAAIGGRPNNLSSGNSRRLIQ